MNVFSLIYVLTCAFLLTDALPYCNTICEVLPWEPWSKCQFHLSASYQKEDFARIRKKRNVISDAEQSISLEEHLIRPMYNCPACAVQREICTSPSVYDDRSCKSAPCKNGGICRSISGIFNCKCALGWKGRHCENVVSCTRPPEINHASYTNNLAQYAYRSEITYSCDKHYNMTNPADAKQWCDGTGQWSGKIPQCLNAESCKSNPCKNGATCKNLLGNFTCTCAPGWKGQHCENAVTCQRPLEIDHASYTNKLANYVYRSEITYSCDKDYNMTDLTDARQWCNERGQWSGRIPQCLYAESCKSNPCKNGATCTNLLGNFTCACATGWKGRHCENAVTCKRPLEIEHASYTNKLANYTYRSEITYSCDKDYNMTDPAYAKQRCDGRGQWSGKISQCLYAESCKSNPCKNRATCLNLLGNFTCACATGWKGRHCDNAVTCKRPLEIEHASYTNKLANYVYRSEITYSCDKHYNMTDPANAKQLCDGTGQWSGKISQCLYAESCKSNPCKNRATCLNLLGNFTCACATGWKGRHCETAVTCKRPLEIEHASYTNKLANFIYKSEITYSCVKDYNMTDPADAKLCCDETGQWSGKIPQCLYAESCKSNPCKNGATCTNVLENFTCACAKGWKGRHCEHAVTCKRPLEIDHVSYTNKLANYAYKSEITYSCDKDYNMTDPADAKQWCDETGQWSGKIPQCLYAVSCKSNPCKNGATCLNLLGNFTCACALGLNGRHCENDVTCKTPLEIEHASFTNKLVNYAYKSEITFSCDKDYNMTDPADAKKWCDETGQWSGKMPQCLYTESCKSNPCHSNGTCTNLLGHYKCSFTVINVLNKEYLTNEKIAPIVGGTMGVVCMVLVVALVIVIVRMRQAASKSAKSNKDIYSSPAVRTVDQNEYSTLDFTRETPSQQTMGIYENEIIRPF